MFTFSAGSAELFELSGGLPEEVAGGVDLLIEEAGIECEYLQFEPNLQLPAAKSLHGFVPLSREFHEKVGSFKVCK